MAYLHREKSKRKRKKRKKQKKKKRNKARKVVGKEDKMYRTIQEHIDAAVAYLEECDTTQKEDEQKEKTTTDSVLPKWSSASISSTPRIFRKEESGMQIYDRAEVGTRLRLRLSVHPRRLIGGPAVPTLADMYLYLKLEFLGIYRRAGEVLLAMRKEESGTFEFDRKRTVHKHTEVTLIGKTPPFAKIAFNDYGCHDPDCPMLHGGHICSDTGLKRCDGWVRWKYFEMSEPEYASDWSLQAQCPSGQE